MPESFEPCGGELEEVECIWLTVCHLGTRFCDNDNCDRAYCPETDNSCKLMEVCRD